MGEETSNTQAPKARDCGYLWDEAESGEHGERVSVLENAMGSLMTKNGHKL